jgi:hypothetical protein
VRQVGITIDQEQISVSGLWEIHTCGEALTTAAGLIRLLIVADSQSALWKTPMPPAEPPLNRTWVTLLKEVVLIR